MRKIIQTFFLMALAVSVQNMNAAVVQRVSTGWGSLSSTQQATLVGAALLLLENGFDYVAHGVSVEQNSKKKMSQKSFDFDFGSMKDLRKKSDKKTEATKRKTSISLYGYLKNFSVRLKHGLKNPLESFQTQSMFNLLTLVTGFQGYLLLQEMKEQKTSGSIAGSPACLSVPKGKMVREILINLLKAPCLKPELVKIQKQIISEEFTNQYRQKPYRTSYCLAGPPGVGKTYFAQSLADLLGYHCKIIPCASMGGNKEGIEFKLHGVGKEYQGARLGALAAGLAEMKQEDKKGLIVLLDEIEKADQLDNFIALLDPQQNQKIKDNYLQQNIDCSGIIFIAAVNDIEMLKQKSEAVASRLTIVNIPPFTNEEKKAFLEQYLNKENNFITGFAEYAQSQSLIESIVQGNKEAGLREAITALRLAETKWNVERVAVDC